MSTRKLPESCRLASRIRPTDNRGSREIAYSIQDDFVGFDAFRFWDRRLGAAIVNTISSVDRVLMLETRYF
jgi:hypothetical protein